MIAQFCRTDSPEAFGVNEVDGRSLCGADCGHIPARFTEVLHWVEDFRAAFLFNPLMLDIEKNALCPANTPVSFQP